MEQIDMTHHSFDPMTPDALAEYVEAWVSQDSEITYEADGFTPAGLEAPF